MLPALGLEMGVASEERLPGGLVRVGIRVRVRARVRVRG